MSVESAITILRRGVDLGASDVATQQRYEHWLKASAWNARTEAIPLIVGVDPAAWPACVADPAYGAAEQELWANFAKEATLDRDDEPLPVATFYDWCRSRGIALPDSFSRLYGFISQTVLVPPSSENTEQDQAPAPVDEKEIVLGAALSLVSNMPERCRDERGLIDATTVVSLIRASAVRWFPTTKPSMSPEQMAALIDKWLT